MSTLSRFTSLDNGQTLDPNSEEVILTVDQPFGNHNGGNIAFGPDGLLCMGLGDSNCSPCHRSGGPTDIDMDLRYDTPLGGANVCNVAPAGIDLGAQVVSARARDVRRETFDLPLADRPSHMRH